MDPIRELMKAHLGMSGEAWGEVKMAEAIARKRDGEPLMKRELRSTTAATNEHEDRCKTVVAKLFREADLWAGLPQSSLTVRHRCLCFRMLSRVGCAVEELLVAEHCKYPVALFRLLGDPTPDMASELQQMPPCVRDAFATRFFDMYGDDLCGPEALAVLTTVAAELKMDIAEVERRHASIRRLLMSRLQTNSFEFADLSGSWMCQQLRTRSDAAKRGALVVKTIRARPAVPAAAKSSGRGKRKAQKQKKGAGGGMRSYFSSQLRERKLKFNAPGVARQLHHEYANLPAAEKAKYTESGARATKRWRKTTDRSKTSFGLNRTPKASMRKARQCKRKAFWDQLRDKPEEEVVDALVDSIVPAENTGEMFLSTLHRARCVAREQGAAAKSIALERLATLKEWRQQEGGQAAKELTKALGLSDERASVVAACMVLEPADHCSILRFHPDIAAVASDLCAFLHNDGHGGAFKGVRSAMEEDL